MQNSNSNDIVILDDCLASGNSAEKIYNEISNLENITSTNLFIFAGTKEKQELYCKE